MFTADNEPTRSDAPVAELDGPLAELIEANPDGMLVVDAEGLVRFANEAAARLLGRPRDALVQAPFGAPVVDGDLAELDLPRGRVAHAVAEMRVSRLTWAGRPAHLVSLRDVTSRKWAELHLRVVYDVSTILARTDELARGLEDFLSVMCQLVGRKNAEIWLLESEGLVRAHARGIPGDRGPAGAVPRIVERVWQRLEPRWVADVDAEDQDLRAGWPPGKDISAVAFLVGARARPLGVVVLYGATRSAEIPQLLGTLETVGSHVGQFVERMRAERARRDGAELVRALFDETPDHITLKDEHGRYLLVSAAAARILGRPKEQLLGHTDAEVAPRAIAELVEAEDRRFLAGESPATVEEVIELDGRSHTFLTTRAVQRGADGRVLGLIRSSRDITERLALAEMARRTQRLESIGVLAGGIAHDFNNVLTAITVSAQLGRAALPVGSEITGDLDEILRASERATELTRQLLAFGRKQTLRPRVVSLEALVERMLPELRRMTGGELGIDVTTSTAPGLWPVHVDAAQLERVVQQLVLNARDALPLGGRIVIETRNAELDLAYVQRHPPVTAGQYVLLSVTDTGVGMPPEVRERVFEPFFTTKDGGRGTGLGLAVVYGIVKQSGGFVWVYSEPGRGSAFKVYLPRHNPPAVEPIASPRPRPRPDGRETILVVDDEAVIRNVVGRILEREGYRVIKAAHGAEAIEKFAGHTEAIDLVVTDVAMPGMTGPQMYAELAARAPALRVIFMSGFTSATAGGPGGEALTPFLEKPFTSETVVQKVREVLDAKR
ncbi:PAS domain-containing protein [Myxococcota bacterium]|nr:PAS domain-containing protein [Myxococcota bacterium]